MNTVASQYEASLHSTASTAVPCFHCGLPVPEQTRYQTMFDGRMRPMCCVGCEAVANTIIDAGMAAFYRERTAISYTAATPVSLASEALFGLERVQSNYVTRDGNLRTAELYIEGITCSACVWLAEAALQRVVGIISATVNQVTHRASVTWDAAGADLPALLTALQRVGLSGQPATAAAALAARRKQRRRGLIELGVALLSMMQVMMFTVPLYLSAADDVSPEARKLMGWAAMVLTLPTILYSARSFFQGALRDLRNLASFNVSMDLPIALAIAAGFGASCAALLNGRGETYFDSISMFVFLLLSARYLEASARESSLTLIERLTNAAPALAWRIAGFPDKRSGAAVAAADLAVGDVIRIATGEMAAADGIIVDGHSAFDESLLTGESLPVPRGLHDVLVGGSLNLESPVLMRVTRCGAQTVAATLRQMTEHALAARPRLVQLADRVAVWIAPLTLLASLTAALIWLMIDPAMSFPVGVAVLAVTCPCALALAAPAAQALATTRLAREGLLITRANTLERIASASDVVFDKTGTITTGQISINVLQPDSASAVTNVFSIAVALENGASHPIALAITKAAHLHQAMNEHGAPPTVAHSRVVAGAGVEGCIAGVRYRLGTLSFVASMANTSCVPTAASLFLACDGALLATFELLDPPKADAAATIATLSAEGLRAHLLSGDRQDRVAQTAVAVKIPNAHVRTQVTPLQKLEYAEVLKQRGATLIAVGDGVNDAPLMGAATVSIAMGRGADLTRLTADAVLMSPHLQPLVSARRVARKMNRIIAQNFCWAIAYNALAVPLAMLGKISPAWAAIGMATSSLVVVANSLRLARK